MHGHLPNRLQKAKQAYHRFREVKTFGGPQRNSGGACFHPFQRQHQVQNKRGPRLAFKTIFSNVQRVNNIIRI